MLLAILPCPALLNFDFHTVVFDLCCHRLWAFQSIQFRQHLYPPSPNPVHRWLPLYCLLVWLSIWPLLIHRSYCWDRVLRETKSSPVNTLTVEGECTDTVQTQFICTHRAGHKWWGSTGPLEELSMKLNVGPAVRSPSTQRPHAIEQL